MLFRSLAMFGKIFSFLLALILCIALFTVGNTMNMAVMERTVEIGTLRAVGLKRGDIQRLFPAHRLVVHLRVQQSAR